MTRIVLLSQDSDLTELRKAMQLKAPDISVHLPGEVDAHLADVAVCWNPPQGSLGALENLRLVHSLAAGVDLLRTDSSCPDVPVCRVVDPDLRRGMAEYVLWGVLHHHRHFDQMLANQAQSLWREPVQRPASSWTIGVMGLGDLGAHVAAMLASLSFNVRGWARSPKTIANVSTWAGPEQFGDFLNGVDCLICLMPLTDETQGILNASTFAQLNPGAVVINCGRGGHVVMDDLLQALASDTLSAALLDVFEHEPLAADDPLWQTPGLTITPHIASSATHECIAEQVIANVSRLNNNLALHNQVNTRAGY